MENHSSRPLMESQFTKKKKTISYFTKNEAIYELRKYPLPPCYQQMFGMRQRSAKVEIILKLLTRTYLIAVWHHVSQGVHIIRQKRSSFLDMNLCIKAHALITMLNENSC